MNINNLQKVFVGNIPFNCSENTFTKAFYNHSVDGFIKGDIIKDKYLNKCRGFGFVLLNSIENAEKLKTRNDIFIEERKLRFTDYIETTEKPYYTKNTYIYIENIPQNVNREYLKQVFNQYQIGKYYINTDYDTGEQKTNGMIEILNYDNYKNLLNTGFIIDNNHKLYLQKWKFKTNKKKDTYKNNTYKVFSVGHNFDSNKTISTNNNTST